MDKQMIEEMAKEISRILFEDCVLNGGGMCENCDCNREETDEYDCQNYLVAKKLLEKYQPKIPENAVVIPKEISCYDNIEKRVKTFSIDGKNVDFTQEQIMALTQIISYKEKQENDIRKETAEKFASGFINDILPKIMNGHSEKALQIAMAMTNYCEEITEKGVQNGN